MNSDVVIAASVATLVLAAYLSALAYAGVSMLRSPDLDQAGRVLWIGALVVFPVIAAIVWFVAGPRPLRAALSFSRR
jgi:uncharacterized membrane protein required for colicin V production